ncbi:MAG: LamG domain-containing protein [Candidatus Poribacteria bacterium]|nr:LamG domain-containing protein [Candidatus Poribacteria bacterium]
MRNARMFVIVCLSLYLTVAVARDAVSQIVWSSPPDDIVFLATFDEGSGNKIVDHSQYGHDMDLVAGNADWVNGKFGKGLHFDGATAFEVLKDEVLAGFTDKITVGAWVSPEALPTWTSLVEMDGLSNAEANSAWKVGFHDTQLVFTTYWVKDHDSAVVVALDTWQHVVWTYDGAEAGFYLNGNKEATVAGQGTFNIQALTIGWRRSAKASAYTGSLDEVFVSNKVLSDGDIRDISKGITLSVDPAGKVSTTWATLKK